MPHPDDFSFNALDAVAVEIGRRLPRLLGPRSTSSASVVITSSLQVWDVTEERIRQGEDLLTVAVSTGRWQHQIEIDGKPEVYARSTLPRPGAADPEVDEVVSSPAVAQLNAAIDWVQQEVGETDEVARLVEGSEYHLWVLWLVDRDGKGRVVVVDAPRTLDLEPNQLYPDDELVRRLREVEPIVGVSVR
jgi:hypothetical protein